MVNTITDVNFIEGEVELSRKKVTAVHNTQDGKCPAGGGDNVYKHTILKHNREVEKWLHRYNYMNKAIDNFNNSNTDIMARGLSDGVRPKGTVPDPTSMSAINMAEPPEQIQQYVEWVSVIKKAIDEMEYFAPEYCRLLKGYFGLGCNSRGRVFLMHELNISQTTLYAWKNICVDWVKALAIYRRLINPEIGP